MWEAGRDAAHQKTRSIVRGSLNVGLRDAGSASGEGSNVIWGGGGNPCVCVPAYVHGARSVTSPCARLLSHRTPVPFSDCLTPVLPSSCPPGLLYP